MPRVSVIVASYNYAQYIGKTLESVLSQTWQDWELIVVDDGSTDHSVEIIQKFCEKDQRIHLYTHSDGKNHGLSATIQLGLEKAKGEWVAFLESDDSFEPTSLEEKVVAVEKHPETVLVFTDLDAMETESTPQKTQYLQKIRHCCRKMPFPQTTSEVMRQFNLIPTFSVVMVKKEALQQCRFDSPIPAYLDWYLWSQLCDRPFHYVDKPLTNWLVHEDSFVHNVPNEWGLFAFHLAILTNIDDRPLKWNVWLREYFRFCKKTFRQWRRNILSVHLFRGEIIVCGKRLFR